MIERVLSFLAINCSVEPRVYQKQPLLPIKVDVRSTYVLPSMDPTCQIIMGMYLLFVDDRKSKFIPLHNLPAGGTTYYMVSSIASLLKDKF